MLTDNTSSFSDHLANISLSKGNIIANERRVYISDHYIIT